MKTHTAAPARILILDDEVAIAEMLGEMLDLLGYTAVKCNFPQQALDLIGKEHFDLVLSDFRMPNMNGQQFYNAAIAKVPALARKIIFLTGDVVSMETKQFLDSTGNPHVAKPFHLANVEKIISNALAEPPLAAQAA